MASTREEMQAEYERLNGSVEVFQKARDELGRKLGKEVPSDLASKHKAEDEAATLFERSTPAERLELFNTDREAWQRMLDAHEEAGIRKLFRGQ